MSENSYKTPPVLSRQIKMTETASKTQTTPIAHFSDVDRIKLVRDLNSPSASNRVRAINAIKTSNKRYSMFDVSHKMEEVTEAERQEIQNIKPKTIQEVFKVVRVYVEVRSGADDLTEGIKSVLRQLGATINDTLVKTTTHVVFKEGLNSTYTKAKKLGIPVVSVLWIEACRKLLILADPTKYPISNLERYENPELFGKVRRPKVMTPKLNMTQPSRLSMAVKVRSPVKVESKVALEDETVSNKEKTAIKTPKVERRQTIHVATPRPNDTSANTTLKPEPILWLKAVDNIHRVSLLSQSIKQKEETPKQALFISEKPKAVNKRRTLFTPEPQIKPIFHTPKTQETKPVNKRRTLFTPEPLIIPASLPKTTQRRRTLIPPTSTGKTVDPVTLTKPVSKSRSITKRKLEVDSKENTPPRPKTKPFLTPSNKRSIIQSTLKSKIVAITPEIPPTKRRRTLYMTPEFGIKC